MTITVSRDVSPVSGIGWSAELNDDMAFGRTWREAVWVIAARQLKPGQSASVEIDGKIDYVVTNRDGRLA